MSQYENSHGFRHPRLEYNQTLITAKAEGPLWLYDPFTNEPFCYENRAAEENQLLGVVGEMYLGINDLYLKGQEFRMARRGYVLHILEDHQRLVVANQPLFIVRYF